MDNTKSLSKLGHSIMHVPQR